MMSERVLILEDDVALATDLEGTLSEAGYATQTAANVHEARRAWAKTKADLCLMDIRLPGPSGKVFCREVRESSDAAVIMMSSLSDQESIIASLDFGADDYVTKPFMIPEMLARMRAVLRRRPQRSGGSEKLGCQIGPWTFDPATRRLTSVDGHTVPLTNSEASVLRFMSQNPGLVFSREDLLAVARSRQHVGKDDRAVDTLIKRMRQKIEPDPSNPAHIHTEWGKGYRMEL